MPKCSIDFCEGLPPYNWRRVFTPSVAGLNQKTTQQTNLPDAMPKSLRGYLKVIGPKSREHKQGENWESLAIRCWGKRQKEGTTNVSRHFAGFTNCKAILCYLNLRILMKWLLSMWKSFGNLVRPSPWQITLWPPYNILSHSRSNTSHGVGSW